MDDSNRDANQGHEARSEAHKELPKPTDAPNVSKLAMSVSGSHCNVAGVVERRTTFVHSY